MPTALVIGASGTFGNAIAAELLARGFSVGLHFNTRKEPCEKLALGSADCALFQSDLTGATAVTDLAAAFLKRFEKIDALVWSCGIVKDAPLVSQPESDLRAVLNTNLKPFFLLLKAFSRQFIKQKSGSILALSSHAAIAGRAGGTAYAMSQSGLISLVKSAAREWGAIGVRVNAVLPPFVAESGMGKQSLPEFAEAARKKRVIKNDPLVTDVAKFCADTLLNPVISGQVPRADSRVSP